MCHSGGLVLRCSFSFLISFGYVTGRSFENLATFHTLTLVVIVSTVRQTSIPIATGDDKRQEKNKLKL